MKGVVSGVRARGLSLLCVGLSVGLSLPQAVSGDYQGISTPFKPPGH